MISTYSTPVRPFSAISVPRAPVSTLHRDGSSAEDTQKFSEDQPESLLSSTPLRQTRDSSGVGRGMLTATSRAELKETGRGGTKTFHRDARGSNCEADQNTCAGIQGRTKAHQVAGICGRQGLPGGDSVRRAVTVVGVLDVSHINGTVIGEAAAASDPRGGLELGFDSRSRNKPLGPGSTMQWAYRNKLFQHTPPWDFNLSPIIARPSTEVRRRTPVVGSKRVSTPKSEPAVRHLRRHTTRLLPVTLFSEGNVSRESDVSDKRRISQQMFRLSHQSQMCSPLKITPRASVRHDQGRIDVHAACPGDSDRPVASQRLETSPTFRMRPPNSSGHELAMAVQQSTNRDPSCPKKPANAPDYRCPKKPANVPDYRCPKKPANASDYRCPRKSANAPDYRCPRKPANAPDYRCPDFLPRQFGSSRPGLVPGDRSRERRSSLGVLSVKSADIAAIYSRVELPGGNITLRSRTTAQQSLNSRELRRSEGERRLLCNRLNEEMVKHDPTVSVSEFVPDERNLRALPERVGVKGSDVKIALESASSKLLGGRQKGGCEVEEFCPADVFLQNVQQSAEIVSVCSTSGSDGRIQHAPVMFKRVGNKSGAVFSKAATQKRDEPNPGERSKGFEPRAAATRSRRQSLPASTAYRSMPIRNITRHNQPPNSGPMTKVGRLSAVKIHLDDGGYEKKAVSTRETELLQASPDYSVFLRAAPGGCPLAEASSKPPHGSTRPHSAAIMLQRGDARSLSYLRKKNTSDVSVEQIPERRASWDRGHWDTETVSISTNSQKAAYANRTTITSKCNTSSSRTHFSLAYPVNARASPGLLVPLSQVPNDKSHAADVNTKVTNKSLLKSPVTPERLELSNRRHTMHDFQRHEHGHLNHNYTQQSVEPVVEGIKPVAPKLDFMNVVTRSLSDVHKIGFHGVGHISGTGELLGTRGRVDGEAGNKQQELPFNPQNFGAVELQAQRCRSLGGEHVSGQDIGGHGSDRTQVSWQAIGGHGSDRTQVSWQAIGRHGSDRTQVSGQEIGGHGSDRTQVSGQEIGGQGSDRIQVSGQAIGGHGSDRTQVSWQAIGGQGSDMTQVSWQDNSRHGSADNARPHRFAPYSSKAASNFRHSDRIKTSLKNVQFLEAPGVGTRHEEIASLKSHQTTTRAPQTATSHETLSTPRQTQTATSHATAIAQNVATWHEILASPKRPQITANHKTLLAPLTPQPVTDSNSRDQTTTSGDSVTMPRKKGTAPRNRNVFRGSVLLSLLVEGYPRHFPNRTAAFRLARRLLREGHIHSLGQYKDFEDSAQLYVWREDRAATQRDRHQDVTVSARSPTSNSISSPERPTNEHEDWQLIEDIRSQLLNRSEASNITPTYNSFFQELLQDFGHSPNSHKKSPPSGGDIARSSDLSPFTSTLQFKKSTGCSTVNHLGQHPGCKNATDRATPQQSHSKHPSSSPLNSKNPSAKYFNTLVSHQTSPYINPHQKNNTPQIQRHQHHHLNSKGVLLKPAAATMNNQPSSGLSSEHSGILAGRLGSAVFTPGHTPLSQSSPAIMDYKDTSHKQEVPGHMTSASVGKAENKSARNVEQDIEGGGHRRSRLAPEASNHQTPQAPPGTQVWLNPGVSNFSGSHGWGSENRRSENGSGLVGVNASRWPDVVDNDGIDGGRRWPESTYSYSDNEKQLLEEMRRMKKEHQNVLRTYEGRINKLMTKMHELRNIAEMLDHSSNKSSPYGVLPGKLALLNILGRKAADGKSAVVEPRPPEMEQVPPPLPPRPGRGLRVYPNKPIIHTSVDMKPLFWSRIILENDRGSQAHTIWQGMTEPTIDTDELQRLFSKSHDFPREVSLYEEISLRRGMSQSQLVSIYDVERSQRITSELRALHCTLPDVIQAFMTLNCDGLHTDSFAELLELLMAPKELDKIGHHVKARGAGDLHAPEYLVFELSKVDHFEERLQYLRFKNKIQINLFEIDQQLRELQTACEEVTSSISLKQVLETVLVVGNHMNAGTDRGQADGFRLDVLPSLKDMQDVSKQCSLLELVMRMYCLKFETDLDFGCPTRFRLPEPSNMRHAAQVSFEDIQRALKELKDELSIVRNKLESLSKREGSALTVALKVTSENFMTSAMEVLADEQKLLEDTRAQFWKTASYFSYDGQKSTPREFFQIWASFLHDCKYYWKLAHRNLAKAKFNMDIVSKSQLSCSSLPGFNSLKSAMMKHVASFQQDEEMTSTRSQQLQHISSWIQSVGKYTMEIPPGGADLSLDANDASGHTEPDHRKLQSRQEHIPDLGPASPPYKNQTVPEAKTFVDSKADVGRHTEQKNKPAAESVTTMSSHSFRHITPERPQLPSSPKPMNATPPNVIKPQPTVHTSSDRNPATPASNSQLTNPEASHRYRDKNHEDSSGFEPLYESLSHYSQNFPSLLPNDSCPTSPAARSAFASPDPDNTHKKNSKFFKSLLKRDQKRAQVEPSTHDSHSTTLKNTSTSINKGKNTFALKLSTSGHSKPQKDYNHSSPAPEASSKLLQGLSLDHTALSYSSPSREDIHFDNFRAEASEADHVNYQNVCFPYHPGAADDLHGYPIHTEQTFYGGHESFPSTVSSLQSMRNKGRPHYQGNILHRQDNNQEQTAFNKSSIDGNPALHNALSKSHPDNNQEGPTRHPSQARVKSHPDNNQEGPTRHPSQARVKSHPDNNQEGPTRRPSQARVRAPIALGSNVSISDVYGKATENAETQTSGTYDYQPVPAGSEEFNLDKAGSSCKAASNSAAADPKWVKASPVPVYKAKLIPNYENQSKYDPRFDGGVRGRAEAAIPPEHAPQISISSDVYRQELQRKSEQYVGGNMTPTSSQTPPNSNSLRGGVPLETSHSILPSKPNHYHAFPTTVPQGTQQGTVPHGTQQGTVPQGTVPQGTVRQETLRVNSSPGRFSSSHARPNNTAYEISQITGSSQAHNLQNNPENGEVVSSADYSLQQTRTGNASSRANFFSSSEKKLETVTSSNIIPFGAVNDRAIRGEHFSAYRSSSAHSILDRDRESRKLDMGVHLMHARHESQGNKSHVSRKNTEGRKIISASHISASQISASHISASQISASHSSHPGVKSDVPQSVTSLIDKFEKGTEVSHFSVGLLDLSDKPPSMTSTPIARRRNQGASTTQPSHGNMAVIKTDSQNGQSLSEGTRRSLFPETLIPESQKDTTPKESVSNNPTLWDNHFSNSQHKMVGTHQLPPQHKMVSTNQFPPQHKMVGTNQFPPQHKMVSINQFPPHHDKDRTSISEGLSKQSETSQDKAHHARNYEQSNKHIDRQFQQSDQVSSPGGSYVVMSPSNQNRQERSQYELSNHQHDSYAAYVNMERAVSAASNSHSQPDVLKTNYHNPQTQTSSQCSPPKPERQNQHSRLQEASRQQQQSRPHNFVDSPSASSVPIGNNLSQQRQPAAFNPRPSSQTLQQNESTSSSSAQRGRPDQDFHPSYKPSTFEPFARAGHGRQPGTMAVVKPTVMNI